MFFGNFALLRTKLRHSTEASIVIASVNLFTYYISSIILTKKYFCEDGQIFINKCSVEMVHHGNINAQLSVHSTVNSTMQ